MYEMVTQKTWNFYGQKLTAHKILKTATVAQMNAGNWEIIPSIVHMDNTLIIPTSNGNIIIDMLGRNKVLLETSPDAYKKLLKLETQLKEAQNEIH